MQELLVRYLWVTGIGAAIALAMPWLVVVGLMALIVPGVILGAMPSAFAYGVVFALGWFPLHRVIGDEARAQCRAMTGGDPDVVVACVGGGSNAAGIFAGFADTAAELVGVEPAGGAAVGHGVPGVVHVHGLRRSVIWCCAAGGNDRAGLPGNRRTSFGHGDAT